MVENIYQIKNQILDRIEQDLAERGVDRMDVTEVGKMVDMVKDLAEAEKSCWEAEYYRGVSEAMEGDGRSGYPDYGPSQGGGRGGSSGRSGWGNQYGSGRSRGGSRRGYDGGTMGHTDVVDSVRMAMQGMDPAERERMKDRIRQAMEM